MAAVVSGSGLGLFNSSVAQLGQAHGGQVGVGQALEGQYVNVATGNLVLQDQDESILTRGLPVSFVRTYNSLGTTGGAGQDGWLHGFERRVTGLTGTVNTAGSTVRRVLGDGTETVFTWDAAANAYLSTEGGGAHDTLTWNTTNSRWTWTEGSSLQREVYDASGTNGGRLISIADVKSGATYNVAYTSGRLTSVVSSLSNGDGLYFTYDAANRLQSINTRESGISRGQVWFEYDGFGRLQSVLTDLAPDTVGTTTTLSPKTGGNDGAGNLDGRLFRTTYAYVSASASDLRIASITQSDGTVVSYGYVGSSGQIATVTRGDTNANDADGLGETLTFTYRAGETDVTDRLGRVTTYVWEAASGNRLREVRMPADVQGIRDVATYAYDSAGNMATVETRRGATVVGRQEFEYDARGNLTRQWSVLDAATGRGQRVDRTYSATNQLLTETTYAEFDPDGRGVLDPAVASGRTVRYLYDSTTGTASTTTNGNKVRFVIDAEGRVTEYLYQTSGGGNGLVRSIRRFEAAYTVTTFSTAALNTWATNAVQSSRSTRTDYAYDAMGRLSEQRDFALVDGNGVGVLDASTQITRFTYDAQGLLRQTIVVRGSRDLAGTAADGTSELTSYAYDGMGRLVGTVRRSATSGAGDAETVSSTVTYLDSTRTIVTTMDSGAVQTEVRSAAGRVVSSTLQATAGVTTGQRVSDLIYDAAGQLRASRDASGAARYFLYDEDGRLATEVDATGSVVAYVYNANGQLIRTTAYANRVTLPAWPTSRDGLPSSFAVQPDAARDRVSTREYDLAGRLTAEVDGEGVRVEIRYDAAGRVERRIAMGVIGTATDDRVTRYFYDRSDRQTAVLDAEGFLTEFTYDGAGRTIRTTSYATAVAPANREAATVAGLAVAADPAKDRVTRHYYNGRDQKVAELDAEGYLTVWTIDEQGNSRGERRYANRAVGVTNADTLAQALAKIANPTSTETRQAYNALGQLVASVDIHGTTTAYQYDEAGRLVRTTRASGTTLQQQGGERDSVVRLNSFGEVIGEISGESLQRAIAAGHIANAAALDTASESVKNTVFGSFGTTHAYDALGRKTETRDASGAVVWFFYDAAGRLAHTLTGLAGNSQVEIVQTRYDAFGQIVGTTAYSARGQLSTANSRESAQAIVDSLNAQGGSTVAWRDAWGNAVSHAQAQATSAETAMDYDRAGRQTVMSQAIGGVLASQTRTRTSYTAFGQIDTQTRDMRGVAARSITFVYDRRGIVSSSSESGGGLTRTTAVKTDAFGNAYEWTDARGVITTATHDRLGRQLTLIRPMDGSTGAAGSGTSITTYDAWGRVLTHTDASNRTTTTTYDDANRTITVSTGDGVTTTTTANRHGETVSVKLLGGTRIHHDVTSSVADQETVFEYDRSGRLVKTTRMGVDDQAGAQSAQNGYDVRGLLVWSTDADGRRTIYRYDAAGRQLESILDPSAADAAAFGITDLAGYAAQPLRIRTQMRVDGQGRTVEMTDGAGTVTRYEYDRAGQQTRVIVDPAGLKLQTVIERDALGQTVVVREGDATNPNLKVARYDYDGLGRRTAERVDPDGLNLTTTYRYDANDNVVAKVDPTGHTTRYVYDADNRLRFAVDPLNGVEETRYDAAGRKIESRRYTQAATLSTAELTGLEANTPGAARTLLASRVSGLSAITEAYAYDQAGRLESVTDGLGQAEKYAHNARGERIARIDRNGNTWRYEYDMAGRLVAEIDPLAQSEHYVLDGAGNRRLTTTRNGAVWERIFDAAGRLDREISPAVDLAVAQPNGLSTTERRAIVTRYTYDGASRLVGRTEDAGGTLQRTFTFEYDTAGRLRREYGPPIGVATLADNGTVTSTLRVVVTEYQRNANGQVTSRTEDVGQPSARTTSYLYDGAGRLTRTTFPIAGAVNDGGIFVSGGGVDAVGAFTLSSTAVYEETGYDATGRVIWVRDTRGHVRSMSYDAIGRLRFEVDAAGGVSESRYDAAGQKVSLVRYASLSTSGVILDGRAPTVATSAADRVLTMQYDETGRLRRQFQSAVPSFRSDGTPEASSIAPETQFRYDAAGNLRQEAVLLESGRWAVTTHFYDALSRKTDTLDALGYLTRTLYTAMGQEREVVEYARAVSGWAPVLAAGLIAPSAAPIAPAPGDAEIGFDRVRRLDYDALGRRTLEIGASNLTTAMQYDALGRQSVTVTNGERQETRYDAADRVVAVLDASRMVLDPAKVEQTNFNSIRELEVARSPLTQFIHDAFGAVIGQRRLASGWSTGQAIDNWTTATLAADDQITRFRRDGHGRVWAEERLAPAATGGSRGVHHAVHMRYDAADNLVRSIESVEVATGQFRQVVSTFSFDRVGRQVATLVTRGGATEVNEGVSYNTFGEIESKTYGGLQGVVQYVYDTAGRLTRTNADGGLWTDFGYTAAGTRVREVRTVPGQTNPAVTVHAADGLGRVVGTRVQDTSGAYNHSVTLRLDRWGNTLRETASTLEGSTPVDRVSEFRYDASGLKTYEKRPRVRVVVSGQSPIERSPELFWEYDAFGRLTRQVDANGYLSTYTYGDGGVLRASMDAAGVETRRLSDVLGRERLSEVREIAAVAAGGSALDANLVTVRDYDHADTLTRTRSLNRPSAGASRVFRNELTLTVNARGDRLSEVGIDGIQVTYEYDSQKRVVARNSAATGQVTVSYDVAGNKTYEGDAYGGESSVFDATGRLLETVDRGGRLTRTLYDATSGRRIGEQMLGGPGKSYAYYANGLVQRIIESNGSVTSYAYDAAGRRTVEQLELPANGSGPGNDAKWQQTVTSYDALNRVSRVRHVERTTASDAATARDIFIADYAYDAAGNRTEVSHRTSMAGVQNQAPRLQQPLPKRVFRSGVNAEFKIMPSEYFRDPDGDALSISFTVRDLDGGLIATPSWLSISIGPGGELTFSAINPPAGQRFQIRLTAIAATGNRTPIDASFEIETRIPQGPERIGPALIERRFAPGQSWVVPLDAVGNFVESEVGDRIRRLELTSPSSNGGIQVVALPTGDSTMAFSFRGPADLGTYEYSVVAVDTDERRSAPITVRFVIWEDRPPVAKQPTPVVVFEPGAITTYDFPLDSLVTDDGQSPLSLVDVINRPSWMTYEVVSVSNRPVLRITINNGSAGIAAGSEFTASILIKDGNPTPVAVPLLARARVNNAPTRLIASQNLGTTAGNAPYASAWMNVADYFVDPEGDSLTLVPLPTQGTGSIGSFLRLERDGARFRWVSDLTPGVTTGLEASIDLLARDASRPSASVTFRLSVSPSNRPPQTLASPSSPIPDRTFTIGQAGQSFSVAPYFTDPDGDDVDYFAGERTYNVDDGFDSDEQADFPPWLSYDSETGVFQFLHTQPATPTRFRIRLRVVSRDGQITGSSTQRDWRTDFDISLVNAPINREPTGSLSSISVPVGTTFDQSNGQLSGMSDPEGAALSYSTSGAWPPGIGLSSSGVLTGRFTSAYSGMLNVNVSDGVNTVVRSFSLTAVAAPVNQPPTGSLGAISIPVGTAFSPSNGRLSGMSDPEGASLTYSPSGAWPSGIGLTNAGVLTGSFATPYSGTLNVTVSDGVNAVLRSFTLTAIAAPVNQAPVGTLGPISVVAGTTFTPSNGQLVGMSDPEGASLTFSASGTWPSGIGLTPGGLLVGTPSSAYSGTLSVNVSDGVNTVVRSFTLTVTAAPTNRAPVRGPGVYDFFAGAYSDFYGWFGIDALVDPEGGPITYTRIGEVFWSGGTLVWTGGMPGGMMADVASRTFWGMTPGPGQYLIAIEGRDAQGAVGMATAVLNVSGGGGIDPVVVPAFQPMAMRSAAVQAQAAPTDSGTVTAASSNEGGLQPVVTETFAYDGLGRMTQRDSADPYLDVVYQYNARGQVVGETRFDEIDGVRVPYTVTYQVDAVGRRVAEWVERAGQPAWLRTRWSYYADNAAPGSAGQLAGMTNYFSPNATLTFFSGVGPNAIDLETRSLAGFVEEATRYSYDAAGRQRLQERFTRPAITTSRRGGEGVPQNAIEAYARNAVAMFLRPNAPDATLVDAWVAGTLDLSAQRDESNWSTLLRRVSYSETTGYDAAGRVSTYTMGSEGVGFGELVSGPQLYTHSFTNTWVGGADGWVEGSVAGSSNNVNFRPTTMRRELDAWGRVAWQEQHTQSIDRYDRDVYRYNADGQVVHRQSYWKQAGGWQQGDPNNAQAPKPNYRFVYANGESLAELREAEGGARVLVSGAGGGGGLVSRAISAGIPRETWQSNLEATNVAGTGPYSAGGGRVVVQPGDTLRSLSQRVYGSASYWYVLAEANGYSSAEDAPASGLSLSAPSLTVTRNDSGTFKPYNPLEAMGPSTPSLPFVPPSSDGCGKVGQLLMVIVAVVVTVYTAGAASAGAGSFLSTMQAGVTALGTNVGAAAIGGAVGSIASQAVGLATGTIQSFSWRGVATSALTAGAGAGVGALAQSGAFGSTLANGLREGSRWATATRAGLSGLGSSIVGGAMNGFSWRGVASNVVGSLVGNAVGESVGGALGSALKLDLGTAGGQFAQDMIKGFTGGVVSQAVSSGLMGNSRISPVNAVGDALGTALVGRWSGAHARQAADVRRVRNGVSELMNWRLTTGDEPASQNWDMFSPQGPYGLSNRNNATFDLERLMAERANAPGPTLSALRETMSAAEIEARYPTGRGSNAPLTAANIEAGYPWVDEMRLLRGNVSEAERVSMLQFMNRYGARHGLPLMAADTPLSELVDVNLTYHVAHAESARDSLRRQLGIQIEATNLEQSLDRSWEVDESWNPLGSMASDAWSTATDGNASSFARIYSSWQLPSLAVGYVAGEAIRGIANIPHFVSMTAQHTAAAVHAQYAENRNRHALYAAGNAAQAVVNGLPVAGFALRGGAIGARALGEVTWVSRKMFSLEFNHSPAMFGGLGLPAIPKLTVRAPLVPIRTVTASMRTQYASPGTGYLNPIAGMETSNRLIASKGVNLDVDHIVPVSVIKQMPGFKDLTRNQMKAILRDTIEVGNLQPLPQAMNASKGGHMWGTRAGEWLRFKGKDLDAQYVKDLSEIQNDIRSRIALEIARMNKANQRGGM